MSLAGAFAAVSGLFQTIAVPVKTIVDGWQKRKTATVENALALAKAKTEAQINKLKTQQDADIKWENTALVNSGIKDEIMMAVVLTPMVVCFIPGGAAYVKAGFEAMNESLPWYWEHAFLCTLAVSYGIRKLTDFMTIRKGG